jgi:hypothetical protein
MRTIRKFLWSSIVAVSILSTACAATKFTTVWKDEIYEGHPAKIMVIGMTKIPATRRLFEDEFVKELKNHDTDAIASYYVLPDRSLTDKAAINAKAKQMGADAVLITKPVGRRTGATESPWANYEDEYIDTETSVYDMISDKLIWTASSETWIRNYTSYETQIELFVKDIVRKMAEQKLVKPESAATDIKS